MRRLIPFLMLVAIPLVVGCGSAKDAADTAVKTEATTPPPLIDRQLFFGDPEITGSQLSPDGTFISFIKPYQDVRNIWVKQRGEPFDAARPVTADERPVPGYFWTRDAKYILYVQDKGGNENWHIYAVDPTAAPDSDTGVPPARDLTPIEGVRAQIYDVPKGDPGVIIVGLNDRDPAYSDVYKVDIATGNRELLIENTQKVGGWFYDLDGNVRLAYRQTEDGGSEILRVEGNDLVQVYTCSYLEQCYPYQFQPDGKRCYFITNKGDNVDFTQLMLFDPMTGETELVESDPEKQVDFGGALFSELTDELMATFYVGDRVRIYPKNKQAKKDLKVLKKKLPDGELGLNSTTADMRYWLVSVSRDVDPGSVYLYDREEETVTFQYAGRPDLPTESLAPMKPVRYTARDGLEIPAYLTLPVGVEPKNLPVVIHPHGGPWARDYWGYDPYPQFLANRGYAVLQMNFRSSSGFGKHFLNAGNKEWGTGAMQHDITDGVKWLIEQGIADPERIAIFGGSYGGYATLAGVTFTPDLYNCGIPYVAPSNIITLIESFPAYWRPFLKGSWYMRVGDPEVEADRADMEARSPINFVDQIDVPLLVVHGANDPRVKQAESDRIVVALRDKGRDVEYLVAPDEGHGFRAPNNRMALAAAMEKFLAKHLGGRFQADMTPEVEARLAEITVDPAGVMLPGAAATALLAQAETGPLPAADGSVIAPCSMKFSANLPMGPQTLDMDIERVIEAADHEGTACWKITDTVSMPMGSMEDTYLVDKATLMPVHRKMDGGMGSMDLAFAGNKIIGEIGQGGQSLPVDNELDAPCFGDGHAMDAVIAGLPLADGYHTTLRQFDAFTQKSRPFELKVTGAETTTVPAGSFETYVVELNPLDGDDGGRATVKVGQAAPHWPVAAQVKMPAMMGGGEMTIEMVEGP